MNLKEKIILIANNLFGSFLNSIFFIYPSFFHFPSSIYFSLVAVSYIASILGSVFFGNLRINENNYIFISSIGVIGPLLSTVMLFYPNQIIFILSYLLFNFTYYSTYFAFLLYYKDVKLNFYFNIYWTVGSIIPQISSLVLSIIYNLYLLAILFFISIVLILSREIYLFLFTNKYELNILEKIDKMFSIAESHINKFGSLYPFYEGLVFPINIRKLRFGYLEFYNMFILIGFSLIWTALVYSVDKFSLSFIFPFLLFVNGIYTSIFYAIYKRNISFRNIKLGIISRFLMGVILFIFLVLYIKNMIINAMVILFLFILAAISWTLFQYFFDNYIINNYPQKFGNIYFFRNIGGTIGSLLLYIVPISYGLILSYLILSISIFFFDYVLKD